MTDNFLLVINPGSTSTKVAVFHNQKALFTRNIEHSNQELAAYKSIPEQQQMREQAVLKVLEQEGFALHQLKAVVGRGGMLTPVRSGAYLVNQAMVDRLLNKPMGQHASNLGAVIAYRIGKPLGLPVYIYDPVAVDELETIARISGLPQLPRRSLVHALNMRAAAHKTAAELGKAYHECKFIVAHLGGGISISVHSQGKMVDIVSDDEGPFSPERAGRVQCIPLVELCYSGKYTQAQVLKMFRGNGGLTAYLGINNAREVEELIRQGNTEADLIYEAMAYQIAKGIGELATVVRGKVDSIILTGGLSYSALLTGWIKERVDFIAPVVLVPGENEMESLALGILRVLNGEEEASEYEDD